MNISSSRYVRISRRDQKIKVIIVQVRNKYVICRRALCKTYSDKAGTTICIITILLCLTKTAQGEKLHEIARRRNGICLTISIFFLFVFCSRVA